MKQSKQHEELDIMEHNKIYENIESRLVAILVIMRQLNIKNVLIYNNILRKYLFNTNTGFYIISSTSKHMTSIKVFLDSMSLTDYYLLKKLKDIEKQVNYELSKLNFKKHDSMKFKVNLRIRAYKDLKQVLSHLTGRTWLDPSINLNFYHNLILKSRVMPISSKLNKSFDSAMNYLIITKSKSEMKAIRELATSTERIYEKIFDYIYKKRKHMTNNYLSERDLYLKIRTEISNSGFVPSFDPIVAFNKNSALPHHNPRKKKIDISTAKHLNILIDLGITYGVAFEEDPYSLMNTDITRNIFIGDKNDNIMKKKLKTFELLYTFRAMLIDKISKDLVKVLDKHSTKSNDKDKVRFKPLINIGYLDKYYKKFLKQHNLKYLHCIGHFIGKEVHEIAICDKVKINLTNNCCFCLEPAVYYPNFFGIRIEDMFCVHSSKISYLTSHPTIKDSTIS